MSLLLSLRNNRGSVINLAMLILLALTSVGFGAVNASTTEVKIAYNHMQRQKVLFAAESGWNVALAWLDSQYPLITENMGMEVIGEEIGFSTGTSGSPQLFQLPGGNSYSADIVFAGARNVPGYSSEFKRYSYAITAQSTGARHALAEIMVVGGKIDYAGGY